MIEVQITTAIKKWATDKTEIAIKTEGFIDDINNHDSVYIGYVGEAAFWAASPHAEHKDTRDYDFVLEGAFVDVKSYWTNYKPKPHYTAFIPAKNMNRGKGNYLFVAVNLENDTAYLIGYIDCEEFKEKAAFCEKGAKKPGRSGEYACNCYELPISGLIPYQAIGE
jgi:hypothetical protein